MTIIAVAVVVALLAGAITAYVRARRELTREREQQRHKELRAAMALTMPDFREGHKQPWRSNRRAS